MWAVRWEGVQSRHTSGCRAGLCELGGDGCAVEGAYHVRHKVVHEDGFPAIDQRCAVQAIAHPKQANIREEDAEPCDHAFTGEHSAERRGHAHWSTRKIGEYGEKWFVPFEYCFEPIMLQL